jgi:hypothetical protein
MLQRVLGVCGLVAQVEASHYRVLKPVGSVAVADRQDAVQKVPDQRKLAAGEAVPGNGRALRAEAPSGDKLLIVEALDYTSIRTETDQAFGRLFAKTEEADRKVADRVAEVAQSRGVPRAQIALAWLLSKPVITAPIVGATKLHQLDDAIASVNVELSAEEIATLEEPYIPHAVVGFE